MNLPHRFPFRFVDREVDGTAVVRLTAGGWWGRDPRGLTLSLLVEAVAQAAALVLGPREVSGERMALAAIESARLDRSPRPGETLEIRLRLETRLGRLVRVRGELTGDGRELGAATVVLAAG